MKKTLAISSIFLGLVFLAGCGQQPVSQTQPTPPAPTEQKPAIDQPTATQSMPTPPTLTEKKPTMNQPVATQSVPKTQATTQAILVSEANNLGTNEYKSANTFSFSYPSKVCGANDKKCYPIKLTENKSVITLDAAEGGSFTIYYGTNITDEKSANGFLQTTLKNGLCKIDTAETNMLPGTTIKNVFLGRGCSLYGPEYEKYSATHPDAIALAGKNRAYWSTDSKEMIVYVIAQGGGCAFIDCELEGKISESINLGGINVYNNSF